MASNAVVFNPLTVGAVLNANQQAVTPLIAPATTSTIDRIFEVLNRSLDFVTTARVRFQRPESRPVFQPTFLTGEPVQVERSTLTIVTVAVVGLILGVGLAVMRR